MTRPDPCSIWKTKAEALVKAHKQAKEAYAEKCKKAPNNFPYSTDFKVGAIALLNQRKSELAAATKLNSRAKACREDSALLIKEVAMALGIGNSKRLEEWLEKKEHGQLDAKKKGRGKSGDRYTRQDYLLTLLPDSSTTFDRQTQKAVLDELRREGYVVSEKTAFDRDIKALIYRGKLFPGDPDDFDDADDDDDVGSARGRKRPSAQNWHKCQAPRMRFEALSVTDALSLSLLESFLQPILPTDTAKKLGPVFQQAKDKLKQEASANKLARWVERVAVVPPTPPFLPPRIEGALLKQYHPGKTEKKIRKICEDAQDTIRMCLFEEQQVKIRYVKPVAEPKWYTLNPLALFQRNQVTYLVATVVTQRSESPRELTFAMHRVIDADKVYLRATSPHNFSIKNHIDGGHAGFSDGFKIQKIRLKAWFSDELGRSLAQTRLSEDQAITKTKDDGVVLTATVIDNLTLREWILSKTGKIEVLEPEFLRKDIARALSQGAARY